jgi:hypothetical protein
MWSFIKICLICIIGIYRLKELFNIYYRIFYELWTFADFDRLCKLEKREDEIKKKSSPLKLLSQSDTILKGTHPGTVPTRFGLIWFSGFRGEDLNAIFYQNMPNLHNRYKSTERKISNKNPEHMLNYSLPCSITGLFMNFELLSILTDYAN